MTQTGEETGNEATVDCYKHKHGHLQYVTQTGEETGNEATVDCYTVTLYLALVQSGFRVLTVEGEDNV